MTRAWPQGLLAGSITESPTIGSAQRRHQQAGHPDEHQGTRSQPPGRCVLRDVTCSGRPASPGSCRRWPPAFLRIDPENGKRGERTGAVGRQGGASGGWSAPPLHSLSPARSVCQAWAGKRSTHRPRTWSAAGAGLFSVERVRRGDRDRRGGARTPPWFVGDVVAVVGRREALLSASASIGEEVPDLDLLQFPLQTADVRRHQQSAGVGAPRSASSPGENGRGIRLKKLIRLGQDVAFLLDTPVQRRRHASDHGRPAQRPSASQTAAGYVERPTPDADLTWLAAGNRSRRPDRHPKRWTYKGVAIGLGTSGGVLIMGADPGVHALDVSPYLASCRPPAGMAPRGRWDSTSSVAIVGLGAGPLVYYLRA